MSNTGLINPLDAIPYIIFLFLPTVFYVFKQIILIFEHRKLSYVTFDTPNKNITIVNTTNKKIHNTKKNIKNITEFRTDKSIMENSIKGLISLGFKHKEAKNTIERLCTKNCYTDESKLILECFRKN